ncbi:MAG: hypothetical protein R3F59_05640 [Myxococcota bacterium]
MIDLEEHIETQHLRRSKLVIDKGSVPPVFAPDSLPPIADEAAPVALVRGAVGALSQTPTPTPDDLSQEDVSTGLFESWDWDAPSSAATDLALEALVAEVDGHARAAWIDGFRGPPAAAIPTDVPEEDGSLDPVSAGDGWRVVPVGLDEHTSTDAIDIARMRAETTATPEPRPVSDSIVDWPPPQGRPGIDYPSDWARDQEGTLIVIDPHRSPLVAARRRALLVDFAAWLLGFVAMFLTGLVTTASAALVLFALTL